MKNYYFSIFICTSCLKLAATQKLPSNPWNFYSPTSQNDPSLWPETCQTGNYQSPINILSNNAVKMNIGDDQFNTIDFFTCLAMTKDKPFELKTTLIGKKRVPGQYNIRFEFDSPVECENLKCEAFEFHMSKSEHALENKKTFGELHYFCYDAIFNSMDEAALVNIEKIANPDLDRTDINNNHIKVFAFLIDVAWKDNQLDTYADTIIGNLLGWKKGRNDILKMMDEIESVRRELDIESVANSNSNNNNLNQTVDEAAKLYVEGYLKNQEETVNKGSSTITDNLFDVYDDDGNQEMSTLDKIKNYGFFALPTPNSVEQGYFRYVGSLTSPNCTENVLWTVFKNKIWIGLDTVDKIKRLPKTLRNNVRKLQKFYQNNENPNSEMSSEVERILELYEFPDVDWNSTETEIKNSIQQAAGLLPSGDMPVVSWLIERQLNCKLMNNLGQIGFYHNDNCMNVKKVRTLIGTSINSNLIENSMVNNGNGTDDLLDITPTFELSYILQSGTCNPKRSRWSIYKNYRIRFLGFGFGSVASLCMTAENFNGYNGDETRYPLVLAPCLENENSWTQYFIYDHHGHLKMAKDPNWCVNLDSALNVFDVRPCRGVVNHSHATLGWCQMKSMELKGEKAGAAGGGFEVIDSIDFEEATN